MKKQNLTGYDKPLFPTWDFSWRNSPSHPLGESLLMLGTERAPQDPMATEEETLSPSLLVIRMGLCAPGDPHIQRSFLLTVSAVAQAPLQCTLDLKSSNNWDPGC